MTIGIHDFCKQSQWDLGEGPRHAPVVLVGEQSGDKEDRAGKPSYANAQLPRE